MPAPLPRTHLPSPALRDRVASFTLVEGGPPELTVLPDTAVVLGLQWRGGVRSEAGMLATAGVTGLQDEARRYAYLDDAATLLVRFTPTGASCLGVPVGELAGRSVPLDALVPPGRVAELQDRVAEAPDDAGRIAAVEALIAEMPRPLDPLVRRALALMETHRREDGPVVRHLAGELGISERQLERRFERVVGLPPKRYAAILRFRRAIDGLERGAPLSEVALRAGFVDQAHLTREVRRHAGATPGALRRAGDREVRNRRVGSVQGRPGCHGYERRVGGDATDQPRTPATSRRSRHASRPLRERPQGHPQGPLRGLPRPRPRGHGRRARR